ncbi:DNA-binding protein [Gammaproteobacteria bacterium]
MSCPVDETAIIDASPLIFLGRAGYLELLCDIAVRYLVPETVMEEIQRRGQTDETVRAVAKASWIEIIPAPIIPETVLAWSLGPGESTVLALAIALREKSTVVVIDDLAARQYASVQGLSLRGTLGIVLNAKSKGRIPLARPVMETLVLKGMYLSRTILDKALERVGE